MAKNDPTLAPLNAFDGNSEIHYGVMTDLAISDVQRRLAMLGYDLGDEAKKGQYGEQTAAAIASFKLTTQLPASEVLDQATWVALVDASLTMGERALYLHMPYFQGRDVAMLQRALCTLGFECNDEGVFNPFTEHAVREFQRNMGIVSNGIVCQETFTALRRLRHAWEGKGGVFIEGRVFRVARAAAPLERQSVCVYGTSEITRSIAERISNLAHATTPRALVFSASSLSRPPGRDALIVGLLEDEPTKKEVAISEKAVRKALKGTHRMVVSIRKLCDNELYEHLEQHCAITILDALCGALEAIHGA